MRPDLQRLTALRVSLHGRPVGVIHRLAGDRQVFALEQEYIEDPGRLTLSLSLKGSTGGLLTGIQQVNRRVPPFFANLLPEGHLRTYLAEQAGVHPEREFFLLAALGADLPGAVTVAPASGPAAPPEEETARAAQRDRRRGGALRFSLAGLQLKFSALLEASGGLTIPARGVGGDWIVKLPSPRFEAVAENEFVMLELARAAGITVPRARLIPVSAVAGLPAEASRLPGNALAVERFDRGPGGERIHMEDFAQVFGIFPEGKYRGVSYANMARVVWAEAGEEGGYEFVRRLVFSVLTGNGDMHLKNWSLLYRDGRQAALAPAYDLLATLAYLPGDQLALTFGDSRSLEEVSRDQLRRLAEKARMPLRPALMVAREIVERTAAAWRVLAERDVLPAALRKAAGEQIERAARRSAQALA